MPSGSPGWLHEETPGEDLRPLLIATTAPMKGFRGIPDSGFQDLPSRLSRPQTSWSSEVIHTVLCPDPQNP